MSIVYPDFHTKIVRIHFITIYHFNNVECIFFQKEAEDVLADALPALEAARLALDDLDKNDVTEIRCAPLLV